MKKHGDISQEKIDRDTDLFESYCEVLKSKGADATKMSKMALVEEAINRPAKKFYITIGAALKIINLKMCEKGSATNIKR